MPKQKAKLIIIVLFLVVALVIFGWYFVMQKITAPQETVSPTTNSATTTSSNIVGKAVAGQLIAGFPSGLVLEGGAVTESVEGKSPDLGKKLLVTFYETKASLDEVYKAYVGYFEENKWKVLTKQQEKDQIYFFAVSPSGDNVNVTAFTRPSSNMTTVQVDLSKQITSEK